MFVFLFDIIRMANLAHEILHCLLRLQLLSSHDRIQIWDPLVTRCLVMVATELVNLLSRTHQSTGRPPHLVEQALAIQVLLAILLIYLQLKLYLVQVSNENMRSLPALTTCGARHASAKGTAFGCLGFMVVRAIHPYRAD